MKDHVTDPVLVTVLAIDPEIDHVKDLAVDIVEEDHAPGAVLVVVIAVIRDLVQVHGVADVVLKEPSLNSLNLACHQREKKKNCRLVRTL